MNPRITAFGARGYERRDEQYAHHNDVNDIGESVVDAVIGKHDDQSKYKRADYPRELFPRTGCEIKKIGVAIVITCADHTDPPRGNEQEVDDDGHPVE